MIFWDKSYKNIQSLIENVRSWPETGSWGDRLLKIDQHEDFIQLQKI